MPDRNDEDDVRQPRHEYHEVGRALHELFMGYEEHRGAYLLPADQKPLGGKVKGEAKTLRGAATTTHWVEHLQGRQGLGIIPLLRSNLTWWAAIDIDDRTVNHARLVKQLGDARSPFVVFRSKSGGAHVVVFFSEPVEADKVVMYLAAWAARLGYAKAEIFPKQTTRIDETDVGNWLNMPYFGGDNSNRFALDGDGERLTPRAAVRWANGHRIDRETLLRLLEETERRVKGPSNEAELFFEGPPCLITLAERGGFGEGERNDGMFAVGVYLKQRYEEHWVDHLDEYNDAMCSPTLDISELQGTLVKSLDRKDYKYPCKRQPIASVCNRRQCVKQRFGIGTAPTGEVGVDIEELIREPGEPVRWIAVVQGQRLRLDTEQLLSPAKFTEQMVNKLTILPNIASAGAWKKYVGEVMADEDKIEILPERIDDTSTTAGYDRDILRQLLLESSRAVRKDEIAMNLPWHEPNGDLIFIKPEAVVLHMKNASLGKVENTRDLSYRLGKFCTLDMTKTRISPTKTTHVWVFKRSEFEDDGSTEE